MSLENVRLEENQLTEMDIRNSHNTIIANFDTTGNINLECIFVDDAAYSTENWINIDETSHFVETQEQCNAIGVEENQLSEDFTIYPNPTTGVINVETNSEFSPDIFRDQNSELMITDILGKKLYLSSTPSRVEGYDYKIDISHLPQGIYYLTLYTEKQPLDYARGTTQKIIKL